MKDGWRDLKEQRLTGGVFINRDRTTADLNSARLNKQRFQRKRCLCNAGPVFSAQRSAATISIWQPVGFPKVVATDNITATCSSLWLHTALPSHACCYPTTCWWWSRCGERCAGSPEGVPRDQRTCWFCREVHVEDVLHALFACTSSPELVQARSSFITSLEKKVEGITVGTKGSR
jgi:hypothetical protein